MTGINGLMQNAPEMLISAIPVPGMSIVGDVVGGFQNLQVNRAQQYLNGTLDADGAWLSNAVSFALGALQSAVSNLPKNTIEGVKFSIIGDSEVEKHNGNIAEAAQKLIDDADGMSHKSDSFRNAQKLQARLDGEKKITAGMLGIQKTLNDVEKSRLNAYMAGLTDVLGIRFARVEMNDADDGKIEDGVVYLSLNPDTYEIDTVYHEIAHALEQNPKTRDAFARYKENLRTAPAFEDAIKEMEQRHKDNGKSYNRDLLESEVAAEFAINVIREVANRGKSYKENTNLLRRVVNSNPPLADRMYQGIRKLRLTMKDKGAKTYRDNVTGISISYRDLVLTENLFRGMLKDVDPAFYSDMSPMYSLKRDGKGRKYWEIDTDKDIFKGLKTKDEYREAAFDFLLAQRDNKTVVYDVDGNEVIFKRVSAEEFTKSTESETLYNANPKMFEQKMRLIPSLQDILLNASTKWHSPDHKNHKMFKERGFENYRGLVRIDDVLFTTIVRIGKAKFGEVFYDINLEVDSHLPHTKNRASDKKTKSTSTDSILQNGGNVNPNERFRLKKNNDIGNFGVKIDTELTAFSRGKMSKLWGNFQTKQVEEGIRNAYRSYRDGDTKEGNRALNEAGKLWASAKKNSSNADVKDFVKHFKSAFKNQEAKQEAIARRAVANQDRQNYGISMAQLVRRTLKNVGITGNRTNPEDEAVFREAFQKLKAGDEDGARELLTKQVSEMFKQVQRGYSDRDMDFRKWIQNLSITLAHSDDANLEADNIRLQKISKSKFSDTARASGGDDLLMEIKELFPEYACQWVRLLQIILEVSKM